MKFAEGHRVIVVEPNNYMDMTGYYGHVTALRPPSFVEVIFSGRFGGGSTNYVNGAHWLFLPEELEHAD